MKKIFTLFLILIIIIIAGAIWWINGLSSASPSDKTSKIFVVQKGSGLKEIAGNLKNEGLIKSRIVFFLYTRLGKFEEKIQAGSFRLSPSMSATEIAQDLTHGTLDIWVTIPEGKRATEIAEILKGKMPNYDSTWPNMLVRNEGYLFPDTYLIPRDSDIKTIVSLMRNNFAVKYKTLNVSKTKLVQSQIVILASLVEREAKFSQDRPLVASVLLNRFNLGMKLDIDATVQYILGYSQQEQTWWRKNITFEDLKINSPYNTYQTANLPPTPIANPGIEALKAVVNPEETDYLYYISDKSGHLHFAKNLQEQNQNIKKYEVN